MVNPVATGSGSASVEPFLGARNSLDRLMHPNNRSAMTPRREFLKCQGLGFGYLAFAALAKSRSGRYWSTGRQRASFSRQSQTRHLPLHAWSAFHVDTFDYKPQLTASSGKEARVPGAKLLGSPWKFSPSGKSGLYISELFPQLASHADKLCILNSMHTELPAHAQSFVKLHTGSSQFVRPSLGAWTLYGLGSVNDNLPGFVTIAPPTLFGGAQNYGSAFLPAIYQGTRVGVDTRPIAQVQLRTFNLRCPTPNKWQRLISSSRSTARNSSVTVFSLKSRERFKRMNWDSECKAQCPR